MKTRNLAVITLTAVSLFCTSAYAFGDDTSSSAPTSAQANSDTVVVPDATLQKNIHTIIKADKTVSTLPVKISVSNGVAALSGNVNTDEEVTALVEDASSVTGVKDVDASKLVVKESTQPFTDTVITAKIKGAFIREQLFGSKDVPVMSITVNTTNGTVYLTGTADSQAQADEAVTIAKSINGVTDVQTKVEVKK